METIGHYEDCMRGMEAAAYLGTSYTAIMQASRNNVIETVRIGGIPYFQKHTLDAYRARREATARKNEERDAAAFKSYDERVAASRQK